MKYKRPSAGIPEIKDEFERATSLHPMWPTDPIHACAIVLEEAGELQRAILHATYEPNRGGPKAVRDEAIQVAAMAHRFLMSLDKYEYLPCTHHIQPVKEL